MLRSLFSGISGLRAHQTMMDVTGNNIANVNTTGFKSSQIVFEDTLSQMIKSASAPRDEFGGTNPSQVGLGVRVAAVTTTFNQGSAQNTGSTTDLMISGDGFFVVRDEDQMLYSRAGAFSFDADGRLCNPNGMVVQGWPGISGAIDTNVAPGDVTLPIGILLPPVVTSQMAISGNLPADTTSTTPVTQSITTFDQQGNEVIVTATWERASLVTTPTLQWNVTFSDSFGAATAGPTPVTFNADGTMATPTPPGAFLSYTTNAGNTIDIDINSITDYAGSATVAAVSQNGSAMGSLSGFTIGQDGVITGTFSNGLKDTLGQIALAVFNNPRGLEKVGETMFTNTVNSGLPLLGQPNSAGRGSLISGSIEMSNVDLGQEFTNLIIAQRGFQANSKIISTSDELLQELVNMKR
ncbi:MAG: flagellar hook protein FlgE [Micromonosporaceae bacterium]|nr:flagellar hook protein FlgE [Micromonosporaceae bacterium]